MKRYRRVWVVYRKELVETLRDRRTLIAMVVVPIVLYPVLMVILLEALKTETSRRQAEHYTIAVPDEAHRQWLADVFKRRDDERLARQAAYAQATEAAGEDVDDVEAGFIAHLHADQVTIVVERTRSLWEAVTDQTYHAGILVQPPPDPASPADPINRIIQVIYRDIDPRSEFVYQQLNRVLYDESERIHAVRMTALAEQVYGAGPHDALLQPLRIGGLSTASPEKQFAKIIAMVVPFLLVTMTVTGAMYPAIDLTAGERERGTLETLAVSPVPTGQIVAGKFGVIVTIAMISTMLNLGSMTAMVHVSGLDKLASQTQPSRQAESFLVEQMIAESAADRSSSGTGVSPVDSSGGTGVSPVDSIYDARFSQYDYLQQRQRLEEQAEQKIGFLTTAAPVVLMAMIPFAVLFGGVMLAACSFARTFKEAQNYMMPVMMAAIIPAMIVSYMPTVRLEGILLVMPVANIVVLMRELFLGQYDVSGMGIVLLSTCLYAAAAVTVAAKLYGHEAVLFSDVGSYKTLLRRRFFRPRAFPPVAFALLTVAVLFPVYFYAQSGLISFDSSGARNLTMVALTQVMIFAAPVVVLAWYLKLDLRRTFSIRLPRLWHCFATLLLMAAIAPVSNLLQQIQFAVFPPSEALRDLVMQQALLFGDQPWWAILLVFAAVPAVCEEVLFRGFLTAGLREKMSGLKVAIVVGVIFAVFHISVERILLFTLMGMVLTFVCLRTGSIFPAMLIHVANNGLLLAVQESGWLQGFYGLSGSLDDLGTIPWNVRAAIFVVVFVVGIAMLATRGGDIKEQAGMALPPT